MLLCQMCQTEIKGYRKLWCSDRCQDKANRTLREEEEYIQRVLDLQKNVQLINTNQIELLGKERIIEEEKRLQQIIKVSNEVYGVSL